MEGPCYDAFIVDGEVPGVDTVQFVREAKSKGFNGPIVGFSGNEEKQESLRVAGCTDIIEKASPNMLRRLRAAVGLS